MGTFAYFTINYILDFGVLRDIRDDWVGLYHEAYTSEEFESRFGFSTLDDGELRKRAIDSMERAGQYRPHKKVTGSVERFTNFYNLLRVGLLLVALLGSGALFGVLDVLLGITTRIPSIIIASIPTDLWLVLVIYLHTLRADDQFVKEFNKEMRFGADAISRAQRETKVLFGYYLWNDGLCNPKKGPALLLLFLIRILSVKIYRRIMGSVRQNLEGFLDVQNYREAFSTAFETEVKRNS